MKRTISVQGEAKCSLASNRVVLTINTEAGDAVYDKMVKLENKRSSLLLAAITAAGFAEKDLKTTDFRIDTEYTYGENNEKKFGSYICHHGYNIEFDYTAEALGRTLAAVGKSGCDPHISIAFTVSDTEAARQALLSKMAANALERAAALAGASGQSVGRLLSISYRENTERPFSPARFDNVAMRAAAFSEITPTDTVLAESAQFVYELAE